MKQNSPYFILAHAIVFVGLLEKKSVNEQWKKNGLVPSFKTYFTSDIVEATPFSKLMSEGVRVNVP